MKNIKNILIPTDFSATAKNAVNFTKAVFKNLPVNVYIVHINELSRNLAEIRQEFHRFKEETFKDKDFFHYEFHVANGSLIPDITNIVDKFKVDLVIMGTKGIRETNEKLSTNTTNLIRIISCPLIVIPESCKNYKLRRIAYANDYKPLVQTTVLKTLWSMASEFKAKVFLLYINNDLKKPVIPADDSDNAFEYYLDGIEHEYIYMNEGNLEKAFGNFIASKEIDLLVTLTRDHGPNKSESEGRLIAELTTHAKYPILTLC